MYVSGVHDRPAARPFPPCAPRSPEIRMLFPRRINDLRVPQRLAYGAQRGRTPICRAIGQPDSVTTRQRARADIPCGLVGLRGNSNFQGIKWPGNPFPAFIKCLGRDLIGLSGISTEGNLRIACMPGRHFGMPSACFYVNISVNHQYRDKQTKNR